jgi:hypothetical protein
MAQVLTRVPFRQVRTVVPRTHSSTVFPGTRTAPDRLTAGPRYWRQEAVFLLARTGDSPLQ